MFCRPGFLPDPNDGSLYILGGKHKEGLMVNSAVATTVDQSCASPVVSIVTLTLCVCVCAQKLPFTIPELVQSAPCRSSDGMLYTGEARSGAGLGPPGGTPLDR